MDPGRVDRVLRCRVSTVEESKKVSSTLDVTKHFRSLKSKRLLGYYQGGQGHTRLRRRTRPRTTDPASSILDRRGRKSGNKTTLHHPSSRHVETADRDHGPTHPRGLGARTHVSHQHRPRSRRLGGQGRRLTLPVGRQGNAQDPLGQGRRLRPPPPRQWGRGSTGKEGAQTPEVTSHHSEPTTTRGR